MGIRTGAEFTEGLRDGRALYVAGERVADVTRDPRFRGIIASLARHYDAFHEPANTPRYTFPSPADGAPVSNSFLIPEDLDQMQARVAGESARQEPFGGFAGRMPDFMNAFVTDVAVVAPHVLGHRERDYADNAIRYHAWCRDHDVCLTHTLVDPKRDYSKPLDEQNAVRVVAETDAGIVVSGARMLSTLAPVSDELFVGPFMPRRPGEEDYAVAFAVPMATEGLRFVARPPYARGLPAPERPLSERFDEGDALAIFDRVLVPWERVFVNRDLVAYNGMAPSFPGFIVVQANVRGRAKLRFMTGLASLMARAIGRADLPRYQELIGEFMALNELADGLVDASAREAFAHLGLERAKAADPHYRLADDPGAVAALFASPERGMVGISMLRFFLPLVNTRVNEIIRLIGSSSLVMTVTEADFDNPEIGPYLAEHLAGAGWDARERVRLMRLAWDAIATDFGGRQELYETFFAGDPALSRQLHFLSPRREEYEALVRRMLDGLSPRHT